MEIQSLIAALTLAVVADVKPKTAMDRCRRLFQQTGLDYVPFGTGNSKTNLAGFCRKVGSTCPPSCPYLRTCYANGGRVQLAQKRASDEPQAAINSFVACSVFSTLRQKHPSRLFVSGDVYRDGSLDHTLVEGLCEASEAVREATGAELTGYGYTHAPAHEAGTLVERFEASGMTLLRSDYLGPGGTIVWPFQRLGELSEKVPAKTKLVKCPAQTRGTRCSECWACPNARKRNLCVVFTPHGTYEKKLELQSY